MSKSERRVMSAEIKLRLPGGLPAKAERDASLSGLPVQEYLRRLIDGRQIRSKSATKAMADLNRLGGLLKMALSRHPDCKADVTGYDGQLGRLLDHIRTVAATVAAPPSERALSIAAEIAVMADRLADLSRLASVRVDLDPNAPDPQDMEPAP